MDMTNTTNTTEADLIDQALCDAALMPEGATIYEDPNCGGFSWSFAVGDDFQSGGIGYDMEHYEIIETDEDGEYVASYCYDVVRDALVAAGYTVA